MRLKLLALLALAVFLPYPQQGGAVALSNVDVRSYLNQRLSARIRLHDMPEDGIASMSINVNAVEQQTSGGGMAQLKYEVVQEAGGYFLVINSRDAIREPIFSFVVELGWPSGHLRRDYALILDPQ